MFEPLTTIRRKIFDVSTPSELDMDEHKQEETLEEWRKKVENERLKIRGSKLNESPYTTYFFKYCQYCHNFSPTSSCFTKEGNNYIENLSRCSKLRVNIKKLDGRK